MNNITNTSGRKLELLYLKRNGDVNPYIAEMLEKMIQVEETLEKMYEEKGLPSFLIKKGNVINVLKIINCKEGYKWEFPFMGTEIRSVPYLTVSDAIKSGVESVWQNLGIEAVIEIR